MKTCTKCGIIKPLSDFSSSRKARGERAPRGGQGVAAACKVCMAEKRKPGIWAARARRAELHAEGMRQCGSCGLIKPHGEFHTRRASKDGLAYKCAECVISTCVSWRESNPSAFKKWASENGEQRVEYGRKWRSENVESNAKRNAEWAKSNPHKVNALIAKRRAMKLKATPSWANLDAIRDIYAEASRLTKLTGVRHEVDHIYPLQGKLVCGLHCEANLQILTKTENIRKLNRMPELVVHA